MKQLEIEFFFPLTEQIPLDLDYSEIEKPKPIPLYSTTDQVFTLSNSNLTYQTTFTIHDDVVIRTKKLSWIGRLLYRTMGLKWELK